MFWKVQTNPFFVGWNKKYKSLILRDIFCPKVGLFFSFVEKSLKNLSTKSMKILFSKVFFTLLRAEPLICQENLTPSRLRQYYVRINSASKKNPCHIIDVFPVLFPVSHIDTKSHIPFFSTSIIFVIINNLYNWLGFLLLFFS